MESKRKIEVGKVFSAKVGKTYLPVKITASRGHGRYEGVNMLDGAAVKVATADLKGTGETVEKWHARQRPQPQTVAAPAPTSPALAVPPTATAASAPAKPKRGKRAPSTTDTVATVTTAPAKAADAKPKKTGALDAAVVVLRAAGEPMNCSELVKIMLSEGLWQTNGRTPAATLYAAMHVEITRKGVASRFRKVDKGMFALTEVGAAETA